MSRFLLRWSAVIVTSLSVVHAVEVASPSNFLPSPTGIDRNAGAANVIYGATVQIKIDHCHPADRSLPPPKDSTPVTYVCGTNPLHDCNRLAFFRDNSLFLASDVEALNMDVPLLQKLPGSNQFKLTFGVQKSTDLLHFDAFPLSAPQSTINAEGKLEFLFTVPDSASFFRVQAP